jgi:hypothetical protein
MRFSNRTARGCHQRRGTVLVTALVCLLIVMAMLGTMLVGALRTGRQLRKERDHRQCELLLQAGLERAAFRLTEKPDYAGETWGLPGAGIIGLGTGQVTIEVSRDSSDLPPQIHVVAEYPTGSEHSIRRSETVPIPSTMPLHATTPQIQE